MIAGRAAALLLLLGVAAPAERTPTAADRPSASCPAKPGTPPPGFDAGGKSAVERFDLSYATTKSGLIEGRRESKSDGGALLFVGTDPVVPPNPDLFAHLEALFGREKPAGAYIEVADVSYLDTLPQSKEEVIRTRGEPSYVGFIARREGVPVLP